MARRLVSGAKEAIAGLRIAHIGYEKIGSDAAIRSQKERAEHDARLLAQLIAVKAERPDSTSRTTGRPGTAPRKRWGPCRDEVDRWLHECASRRPCWRRNRR